MIRAIAAAFAASMLLASPLEAEAQSVRTIAEEPSGEVKGDPNRRVCRIVEVTGSRLKKGKRCRTAREWTELDLQTRLAIRQLRQPQDGSGNGGVTNNITLGRPQ